MKQIFPRRPQLAALITLTALGLGVTPGGQAIERKIDPDISYGSYVGVGALLDSNVSRSAANELDSAITEVSAGLRKKFEMGQQSVTLVANLAHHEYDETSELSHTGGDLLVRYGYVVGRNWRGDVSFAHIRTLRDQENLTDLDGGLRTTNRINANVIRALSANSQLELRLAQSMIDIERNLAVDGDVDRSRAILRYRHEFQPGKAVGVEANYLERSAQGSDALNDFEQQSFGVFGEWLLGSKTQLKARVMQTNRELELSEEFSGVTGAAELNFALSERSGLQIGAARYASNLSDESVGYAVIDQFSVTPRWQPTSNLSLSAFARLENRDFEGTSLREDDVLRAGIEIAWRVLRASEIVLSYEHGDRSSSDANFDFDYNIISLQFRLATVE